MYNVMIGAPIEALDTPALCLDASALERNVARMGAFFADKPASLRPHCKTHKCPTIAHMQLRAGAIGITCAKLGEAEVMAAAGVRDLLIANQIIGATKITRLVNLAAWTNVMVAVEQADNARQLSEAAETKGVQMRAIIEVDVGMGRCGTAPGEDSLALAQWLDELPGIQFEGIMGYEGHAVMIPDPAQRRVAAETAMAQLVGTRDMLLAHGLPCGIVSGGGTGTYFVTGDYAGVTEVQAGSYVTMDAKYRSVGIDFEQALSIVSRVIGVHGDSAIIDAGMKTMTHEFGFPPLLEPWGWVVDHLSEEHGALERRGGADLHVGDLVTLVPSHGCTTINLHDQYFVTRDGVLEAIWPVAGRGRVR